MIAYLWLLRSLFWALSVILGSFGTFILYFGLTGRLSPALSADAVIFLGAAVAIVWSLPYQKDDRPQ